MSKRIIYWTSALAIVGSALGAKSARIDPGEVLVGAVVGAVIGASIGWLIDRRETRRARGKK